MGRVGFETGVGLWVLEWVGEMGCGWWGFRFNVCCVQLYRIVLVSRESRFTKIDDVFDSLILNSN